MLAGGMYSMRRTFIHNDFGIGVAGHEPLFMTFKESRAQAVIGLCNAWGELIVRDPDMDLFATIQKCTDLLLRGMANTDNKQD